MPLYHEFTEEIEEPRHILMRDERNASYAASGYAKASGKVGVLESPSGGGALYILPGLSEALNSSIPLLTMTTDLPGTVSGKGSLTELPQERIISTVVKGVQYVRRPDDIPAAVRKAIIEASTGRPGPSHLILPLDVLEEETSEPPRMSERISSAVPHFRYCPPEEDLKKAIDYLLKAERPIIVAGGGVHISGAYSELQQLSELFLVPVATTLSGKGSFPETHPAAVGIVGENGSKKYSNDLYKDADLVVFVGCKLGSVATFNYTVPARKTKIIHIEVDPTFIGRNLEANDSVLLFGDAKLTLQKIVELAKDKLSMETDLSRRSERIAGIAKSAKEWWEELNYSGEETKVRPHVLFRVLRNLFRDDKVIISTDPGTSTPSSASLFPIAKAGPRFLILRSHGALGNGLGMSIGAKIARPDHELLFFTGDGSLGMSSGEIETSVREDAPLRIFLFQNSSYSWIKAHMRFQYDTQKFKDLDFTINDWAKVAEGYGADAFHLTEHGIEAEIKKTIKSERTVFYVMQSTPLEVEPPLYWPWLSE